MLSGETSSGSSVDLKNTQRMVTVAIAQKGA